MITINQETDETYTLQGLDEADVMTLFMMAESCRRRVKATEQLSEEAGNLTGLIADFYQANMGHKPIYVP
jgi:hypothetical protein